MNRLACKGEVAVVGGRFNRANHSAVWMASFLGSVLRRKVKYNFPPVFCACFALVG